MAVPLQNQEGYFIIPGGMLLLNVLFQNLIGIPESLLAHEINFKGSNPSLGTRGVNGHKLKECDQHWYARGLGLPSGKGGGVLFSFFFKGIGGAPGMFLYFYLQYTAIVDSTCHQKMPRKDGGWMGTAPLKMMLFLEAINTG